MTEPIDPVAQSVTIVAARPQTNDDVTVRIAGHLFGGWLDVRITRGIERLPSDFELRLTDFYAADADVLIIKPGDPCVVMIGGEAVVTGYVDIVVPRIAPGMHEIVVLGRGKCSDLMDCSAEWPGGQISGSSVLEIARKLAAPYGITVDALTDPGGSIPRFNLIRGETPFEIIDRLCRFRQLLLYDDVDGNLVLSRVSTTRAASGFREGINVQAASATLSAHERFSEYVGYLQSVDQVKDLGGAGDAIAIQTDATVLRHRRRIIIAENSGGGVGGIDVAKSRVGWEASRRYGRSYVVRITTDAWRDMAGNLYAPNTLVTVDAPSLKVTGALWTIGEVTYRKGEQGTLCDLVIMPPQAFDVAPTVFDSAIPAELSQLPSAQGPR